MLSRYDWLRRAHTGGELLATLELFTTRPALFEEGEIGPPHSALGGPCCRCWVYARWPTPRADYCPACHAILERAGKLNRLSRSTIVIWGYVSRLSRQIRMGEGFEEHHVLGAYIHDEHHFLLVLPRRELKPWLQELLIYHGADLKGLLQVFPAVSARQESVGELLCRVAHHEARFPMDQLRVRFYAAPHQILVPWTREQQGKLTFEVSDFLSLLEMAAVFRTVLLPGEQASLRELVKLKDPAEIQFYWGRFLGSLSQEARDMLNAWGVRQWPEGRVQLLYELTGYVAFYQSR